MKKFKKAGIISGNNDAYLELASAIIAQACADYINYHLRTARPKSYTEILAEDDEHTVSIKKQRSHKILTAERHYISAVKFLDDNNGWYTFLSDVPANALIKKLDEEIVTLKKQNKKKWSFER